MIPFAVVGSDQEYQVNGRRLLGRKTKWGTIEGTIPSPLHSSSTLSLPVFPFSPSFSRYCYYVFQETFSTSFVSVHITNPAVDLLGEIDKRETCKDLSETVSQ